MDNKFLVRLLTASLIVATFLSLPLRPLWTDEIYQLHATRDLPFGQMLEQSMAPWGMPLAYVTQKLWLTVAGYSVTEARVPAAVFGIGAAFATGWIAWQLSLKTSLPILLSLITPLLFRYSTEARPYSQGLFFSTLSTALFLYGRNRPSKAPWLLYLLCNIAGIYSQPFSFFTPLAHAAYALYFYRKLLLRVLVAICLTGGAFLPCFFLSAPALNGGAAPRQSVFSWHQISPLLILREISGGGYVCSVALLLLALGAFLKQTRWENNARSLLLLCIAVPTLLAMLADASFNYFFAIRQLVFVVPPLLVLATGSIERLRSQQRVAVVLLACLYVAGALVKDVRWQRDRKEDWQLAAADIKRRLNATRSCVSFVPPSDAYNYYFFEPSLSTHVCEPSAPQSARVVAVSPYAPASQRHAFTGTANVGGTLLTSP